LLASVLRAGKTFAGATWKSLSQENGGRETWSQPLSQPLPDWPFFDKVGDKVGDKGYDKGCGKNQEKGWESGVLGQALWHIAGRESRAE
jgi:hypothetical protein